MHTIQIKNARVLDPSVHLDEIRDLFISGDTIVADLSTSPTEIIDGTGLWVVPGLIDAHVHLREPGGEIKETIETGLSAAAAGGFTLVMPMPNTTPAIDNLEMYRLVMNRAASLRGTRVLPVPAISIGRRGTELVDFAALAAEGAVCFSDDGTGVEDDGLMTLAFEQSAALNVVLAQHSEYAKLSRNGVVHEGKVSAELGIPGWPLEAEEKMVARDISLAAKTGGRLHVSHISSQGSVELVRRAKASGLSVTAEVTPHHLMLTDELLRTAGTQAKVNPPLRPEKHVEACRAGLLDGTIDIVATDHAPHTLADKGPDFIRAAFGMTGLEIAVPVMLALVSQGILTPSRMVEAMSTAPARLFGLKGGSLVPGSAADVTLIDPNASFVIDPETFRSKGRNTPFAGMTAPGRAVATIVGGKVIYKEKQL